MNQYNNRMETVCFVVRLISILTYLLTYLLVFGTDNCSTQLAVQPSREGDADRANNETTLKNASSNDGGKL